MALNILKTKFPSRSLFHFNFFLNHFIFRSLLFRTKTNLDYTSYFASWMVGWLVGWCVFYFFLSFIRFVCLGGYLIANGRNKHNKRCVERYLWLSIYCHLFNWIEWACLRIRFCFSSAFRIFCNQFKWLFFSHAVAYLSIFCS